MTLETNRVPLALPVPRVVSTGEASGTRKTCYENKFLRTCYTEKGLEREQTRWIDDGCTDRFRDAAFGRRARSSEHCPRDDRRSGLGPDKLLQPSRLEDAESGCHGSRRLTI